MVFPEEVVSLPWICETLNTLLPVLAALVVCEDDPALSEDLPREDLSDPALSEEPVATDAHPDIKPA